MNNDWPADDADIDLALNDEALGKLLDTPAESEPRIISECVGFDESAGNNWLYPNNLPLRSYQHSIVQAALYRNTLVVLPTGLGKTFIAAVVMYNFHRWYPEGKLIFMAPTRPLVAQQITACQTIMPFSPEDTVELTGRLPRAKRAELWATKRVFFATPQVVQSDMLDTGDRDALQFPYMSIKLLVVDEAHRAKGRYAYTQVTESIMARNPYFRMLALSATPGRTMEDVAAVCRNLYISHLDVRWDDSIDVRQYVHKRNMRTIVVPLDDRIKEPRAQLLQIIDPYLRQLITANVLKGARGNISRNNLLYDQSRYQENVSRGERHPEHSLVVSNFSMCISLYHALELLERHGLRVFVNNFDSGEQGRDKFVLKDVALRGLVEKVRQELGDNPLDHSTHAMTNGQVAPLPTTLDFGHPKYEQARLVMLKHFESHADSRAIVFCEYRESVMLIQRLLLQHRPMLRPRCFVGQNSSGNGICALTQKEQLQIMSDFRQGTCNVLVATSIGEEGLDVGEVELIVCFDICSSNPTRFTQRIGRTGRKKNGDVIILVTDGREQQLLKEMLANKDQMNRKLLQSTLVKSVLYQHAPRLVPPQFHPRCEQRFMEPIKPKPQAPSPTGKGRKQPMQPIVKCHDLRKYFALSQDKFLQGEPTYKVSEASQQLLQEQAARQSVPIQNFLLDTQEDHEPTAANAPLSASSSAQDQLQRLRKITRLLQATKPLVSDSQRNQDLVAQLQDKQLPIALKLYLIECNAHFVRDIHTKMMEQLQRQLPATRLNSRQQRTRKIYEILQSVCGEHLERILEQGESSCAELTLKDLQQPMDEQSGFEKVCVDIFEGLQETGICADNHELLQQEWEQLELRRLEQTVREQLDNEATSLYEDWQEQETAEDDCLQTTDVSTSVYQSQWAETARHSSTPLRERQVTTEKDSTADCNQLNANLSRLNCLMSAASTPLQKNKQSKKSLLDELDEDLSTFDQLAEQQDSVAVVATPEALELDLNDFLEPLPEEQLLQQKESQPTALHDQLLEQRISVKENQPIASDEQKLSSVKKNQPEAATPPRIFSPDIFAEDSMSPWKPTPPAPAMSLAAKLAAKPSVTAISAPADRSPDRTSAPAPAPAPSAQLKSPSIFENYLRRMRGHGHLSKEAQRIHTMTSNAAAKPSQLEEDSPIMRRRPGKRKAYDISDEEKAEVTQILDDESFEEVPATQPDLRTPPRRKRAKFNEFILEEADQSGSNHEEDEHAERSFGAYLKDSVIVSSDDEEHNDTTTHAMYLRGIRSPVHRPGAFKMPAPRRFDEESIYSQPVEPEPSQYYPCSFVVNDDSAVNEEAHNISECPLERAERILKEQRRQRRRQREGGGVIQPPVAAPTTATARGKRRRIQTLSDSSDDDVIFIK
ncbi:uncharacterized protein LOC111593642 isoform X2 [Drosophila hydei]|uniref:Uncharacterized protein LOC111593642 isoform X2 n=1 Tax=Drosophila hydei TaxID=7224 RepID=A0A6J1LG81_DROHY|nr:uncharacterized protein LOC111593642 isoform X2 [Drosophila hydei]